MDILDSKDTSDISKRARDLVREIKDAQETISTNVEELLDIIQEYENNYDYLAELIKNCTFIAD